MDNITSSLIPCLVARTNNFSWFFYMFILFFQFFLVCSLIQKTKTMKKFDLLNCSQMGIFFSLLVILDSGFVWSWLHLWNCPNLLIIAWSISGGEIENYCIKNVQGKALLTSGLCVAVFYSYKLFSVCVCCKATRYIRLFKKRKKIIMLLVFCSANLILAHMIRLWRNSSES